MNRNCCDTYYKYYRTIDYFILTKDIAVVKMTDSINDRVVNNEYFYYHPNNIKELKLNYNKNEDIVKKYNDLYIFPNDFIELYRTTIYGTDEFYNLFKVSYKPENMFNLCNKGIDETTLVYTSYDSYTGTIFRYDYNAENTFGDWIPHPVRFNRVCCYMITDREYDLEAVAKVVEKDIELGKVLLSKSSRYDENEIIRDIEAYNAEEDYTQYINLFVIVENAKDVEYDSEWELISYKKKIEHCLLRK